MIDSLYKKSTIVRICLGASLLPLLGCATTQTPPAPCAAGTRLVCESFAEERRCDCTPRADLHRTLEAFGTAAWPGGNH
jgi:hypothetical protein